MQWTPVARRVLERRYLRHGHDGHPSETPDGLLRRVAAGVAAAESAALGDAARWERSFYELMASGSFLPNSPTLMNAGRPLGQLAACFVLPVPDSIPGIFESVKHAAIIHQSGGGTGFAFSRLRPDGDHVDSTDGQSSGPVSFMRVFDAATDAIKQGGKRRGANMGVLAAHHPDVRAFMHCKDDGAAFRNFNISVGLDRRFFDAHASGRSYDLVNPRTGDAAGEVDPRALLTEIAAAAHRTGEPGVLFMDHINDANPTPALGAILATNPCGEQPLLPYEACTLGSLALPRFMRAGELDLDLLHEATNTAIRFLDDVVTANRVPVPQIEAACAATRKIGLGVMGFADVLAALRVPYDSKEALAIADDVMGHLQRWSLEASTALAQERGVYPAHEQGPETRNATRTTVAPTGTLSILADVTPGIEPAYALVYQRRALDGEVFVMTMPGFEAVAREEGFWSDDVARHVARTGRLDGAPGVPEWAHEVFRVATEIPWEAHVRMQARFQAHVDAAVSKTVNMGPDATPDDVAAAYQMAHRLGCKGLTVYRQGARQDQVLDQVPVEAGDGARLCHIECAL